MYSHRVFRSIVALGVCAGLAGSAHADIVVVVNPKNSNAALSAEQVAALYLGNAREFPDGTPVMLADHSDTGQIRDQFYQKVAGRSSAQVKATWARIMFTGKGAPPKELKSAADVKAFVATEPKAIAYLDSADLDGSVKQVLAVK
jgi:ABC-type phosphate transport system substrate-binding protein